MNLVLHGQYVLDQDTGRVITKRVRMVAQRQASNTTFYCWFPYQSTTPVEFSQALSLAGVTNATQLSNWVEGYCIKTGDNATNRLMKSTVSDADVNDWICNIGKNKPELLAELVSKGNLLVEAKKSILSSGKTSVDKPEARLIAEASREERKKIRSTDVTFNQEQMDKMFKEETTEQGNKGNA